MERRKVLFTTDWYEILQIYDEHTRFDIYEAVMKYAHTGIVTENLAPVARMAFTFIRKEMDANEQECKMKSDKRSQAARKAIQARWDKVREAKQETAETPPKEQIPEPLPPEPKQEIVPSEVEEHEEKPKKKTTRFKPPTVDEVNAYLCEKGVDIDAERFVLFYESKGWMIGKNKMKSWKAAVGTWVKSQKERYNGNQRKESVSSKQDANNYAMQQYLDDRKRVEEGLHAEIPKPF